MRKPKPNFIRKYVDFYVDSDPREKLLLETFFPDGGFYHPKLANISLRQSEVLKATLNYFFENVIQKEKAEVTELQNIIDAKNREIERLNSVNKELEEAASKRAGAEAGKPHQSRLKGGIQLE